MTEAPFPVKLLPTVKPPLNPKSWYFLRYISATRWRRFRNPDNPQEFFAFGDVLAFRSTTPVSFIRTSSKVNKFKIEFYDWKEEIMTKHVIIEDVPCRTYCMCTNYGNPNGTIIISRLSVDEKTVVCGFQDQNGIYIGILSNKLARNEICKRMMLLIPARTREQAVFQARGRVQRGYKPLSQEFCTRDHREVNYYMYFCWLCRGVEMSQVGKLARSRGNIRPCICKKREESDFGDWYLRDSDIIRRDELEYKVHGRNFFECNLPDNREYADPLLACLD